MISFLAQLAKPKYRFVGWIALLAAIGGFLFGFDTGVVGSAEPYFSKALHIGSFGESWVVGSLLLGAVAGAVVAGWLADAISRKWTKFVGGCIYTVAAIGSAFAPTLLLLCIARFVIGLAVGTASFVAPMYISEQSPAELRGGMTALNQVMITFGIMIAYLSDWALSGLTDNWRWMFGVEAVPGAALAVAMVFVPHTPRWLLQEGREPEAEAVMERTRPQEEAPKEMKEMKEAVGQQSRARLAELFAPRLRPFLLVGCALAIFQQLVGINAVIYFGATILKFMGAGTNSAVLEAISLGVVNFLAAVVAALLLDWAGRRKLLIGGTAGIVVSLGALGWYFSTATSFQHADAWIGLVCVLAFLAAFEISLGPVFWLMISEIYPMRIRAKAMATATMFNWVFNFLVSYFFLSLTQSIGRDGSFWLYGFFGLCALGFSIAKVPETRRRSLEQIERDISGSEPRTAPQAA